MEEKLAEEVQKLCLKETLRRDDVEQLLSVMRTDKVPLFEFIEQLRKLLTSDEEADRIKGMNIMRHVLEGLPPDYLNDAEIEHLILFVCQKLNETHAEFFAQMIPILGVCLMRPPAGLNPKTLQLSMSGLKQLLETSPTLLQDHIGILVQSLQHQSTANPHQVIRSAALRNLAMITLLFDVKHLISWRPGVMRSTRKLLDDRKRLVRRSAAEVMGRWISLGQPGS